MSTVASEQVQSVLAAMGGLLGFNASVIARQDMGKGGLVLSIAPHGPEIDNQFRQAIDLLGFDPSGAVFPMWAEDAIFVRCYRQGRLMSTTSLAELIGGALPSEAVKPIDQLVGPRLFVTVPVLSSGGTILSVLMFAREDTTPLSSDERDRLLLYADRVGQLLEADRLGEPPVPMADGSPVARWLSVHLLDRSLSAVWSGGAGPDAESVVEALGGRVLPGTREVNLSDGAAVLVHVNAVDPTGQVAWLLLCENLASRDREARDLREQLRLQLARVQEAVVSVDAELRVTGCNDAAWEVLGYEPAEMIGQPVTAFLPEGAVKDSHRRLVQDLLAHGHLDRQIKLKRRDGKVFPAEISVLLQSDEAERPSGAIATVRDLSEQRRQAAEHRRLRRKLIRSERLAALGEMAARIAHEVRNPLAAIGATALAIEEDSAAEESARQRAGAIGAEVRRLDTILTDLLMFAKPRAPARRSTDLSELIRETLSVVRADPQAKGVEFRVVAEGDGHDLRAKVDPDGVKQAIINLLRNAVEACGQQGEVSCSLSRQGSAIRIDIVDSGPGLRAGARRRVFEPFFSTKSRGTGLGLPITRRIVEEHNGTIQLRARRGQGTRVTVELPISGKAMPKSEGKR